MLIIIGAEYGAEKRYFLNIFVEIKKFFNYFLELFDEQKAQK